MLKRVAINFWRLAPRSFRRLGVLLSESRFTVTAGAIITDDHGRVLLLHHSFRPGCGWGIPGGFIRPYEQPVDALQRELSEEIGIDLQSAEIAFVRSLVSCRQIEIIFRCRTTGDPVPQGFEISQANWFPTDSLPEGLSSDQRNLIATALTINNQTF